MAKKKQKQFSDQTEKLGKHCYYSAMKTVGDMWSHFSEDMHWAFVSKEILSLLMLQDDAVSDANVRAMMNEVTEYCREMTFK